MCSISRFLVVALVGGSFAASGVAATFPERSPFELVNESAPPSLPGPETLLELRGIVSTNLGYLYGIYDPATRQSIWVSQGEPQSDYAIESHDIERETVTVTHRGNRVILSLKTAPITALDGNRPASAGLDIKREIEIRRALRQALREERFKR